LPHFFWRHSTFTSLHAFNLLTSPGTVT
jgi:hypothetical protein